MKCSDLKHSLSLYAEGLLGEGESASIMGHLEICPLCRQRNSEFRELRANLKRLARPTIPNNLKTNLRSAVRSELRLRTESATSLPSDLREWLKMSVMPYGVGVFASVLIGITFLMLMFSGMLRPQRDAIAANGGESPTILASNSKSYSTSPSAFISPTDFAHSRMGFANDSPSINPQGGLVALTKSMLRGEMKDEEVVVVADVFGNGLATISEVVESPRNSMAVLKLEQALQSDPSFAPFVPAVMENRPENMRIVLKFKSVDVSTTSKASRRRS